MRKMQYTFVFQYLDDNAKNEVYFCFSILYFCIFSFYFFNKLQAPGLKTREKMNIFLSLLFYSFY